MSTSSITVKITTNPGFAFVGTSFNDVIVYINGQGFGPLVFSIAGNVATSTPISRVFASGTSITISLSTIQLTRFTPSPTSGQIPANFTATTDIGAITTTTGILTSNGSAVTTTTDAVITAGCLHGSSLVQMKDGLKRLDQIKEGDQVLTGHNLDEYTEVKAVVQCWLTFMGVDHDAIVFEPGSLFSNGNNEQNEPSHKLMIDPGHPICTQKEYLEYGYDALRPAATYWEELKEDKIYTKKWTDIFVQNEPSLRYDLALEEPYNTYVANGMVIRAKGYKDHRYKEFV